MRIQFGRLVIFAILLAFGLWLRSLEQRMGPPAHQVHKEQLRVDIQQTDLLEDHDRRLDLIQRYWVSHHTLFNPLWETHDEAEDQKTQ